MGIIISNSRKTASPACNVKTGFLKNKTTPDLKIRFNICYLKGDSMQLP